VVAKSTSIGSPPAQDPLAPAERRGAPAAAAEAARQHEADDAPLRHRLRVLADAADVVHPHAADRGQPLLLRLLDRQLGRAQRRDLSEPPAAVDQRRNRALLDDPRRGVRHDLAVSDRRDVLRDADDAV
jgi:hypothetical protein